MKKILLSAAILLGGFLTQAQVKVLYFNDYSLGADQVDSALIHLGFTVTKVTDNPTFQTEIATPANFDLAIYFAQNYSSDSTSVAALVGFVGLGKKGMYADWSSNATTGTMVGVSYTGTENETVVTISDAALAAGLPSNPFTITNTGWGTFATGMNALAGSTVAGTFSPSGDAAVVRSLSGDMLVFGFLSDVMPFSNLFENTMSDFFNLASVESNENNLSFSVYPNPTTGLFNINMSNTNSSLVSIRVVDMQGKVVYASSSNNFSASNNKQINIEGVAKGLYTVQINSGNESKIQKLIVE